ncbi:MAG TPA: peptide ABC transporter ATP-binding protein, partial [Rhodospirillaceae bacterium]|nr:peptide ABC transporter ATP-binding protein [Rhodospirillaceae bacterium]
MDKVLDVKGLKTNFYTEEGLVKAVDDLSFHINKGECVALVGESGCGKSASAMSILRLIPYPPGVIEDGEIFLKGENLLNVSEERIREVRGNEISMIFQEPMTSLNPVLKVGFQICEAIVLHRGKTLQEAEALALEMLRLVRIPEPEKQM